MPRIDYYVDGVVLSIPSDMAVSHAANMAMSLLGRTSARRMILERESGRPLDQQSQIGGVCAPGEPLKLVPAPLDDREDD
jgi:hypothetical protein